MGFESVRQAAAEVGKIAASYGGLDVIACNAGVMAVPDTRTGDGFETQMQTNHLSHFLLVDLLLPSLEAAATSRGERRVVTHSSGARRGGLALDKTGMLQEQYFVVSSPGTLGGNEMPACFDRYLGDDDGSPQPPPGARFKGEECVRGAWRFAD